MWEGGGTVPPELGIARRLIAREHAVHVIGDPTIDAGARAIGAGFTPWRDAPHVRSLRPEDALIRDWEITNPLAMFRAARDALLCGPTRAFAEETRAAIDAFAPDVLAADMVMIGATMAAQRSGVPVALLIPNLYPFPSAGRPMIGSGFMPAANVLGRARDAVMARVFTRLFDGGLAPVNEGRAAMGLPPLCHTFDQATSADVLLLLTSRAFDFPGPPLPANVRYVGAQLDDPVWADPWTPPWPAGDRRPLVLVGFSSTFQNQRVVLERVVAALGGLDVRGLVTVGPALDGLGSEAPVNVAVVASAPHAQVIPSASLVISHCGHGTTLKTLSHGVPLVCLPMGRDQVDNAARVVWHGAGVRLKPSASADAIRGAVATVIGEERYRRAAQSLAARLREERGATDRAVIELERLASRGLVAAAQSAEGACPP
jgi:MGT family glycosyltransferase